MAAFSSLALLGLGLAGGMALRRKKGNASPEQSLTTERLASAITPPPAPAPASQTTSTNTANARRAGQRQRRRAAVPVSGTNPARMGSPTPTPVLQPASLLGF